MAVKEKKTLLEIKENLTEKDPFILDKIAQRYSRRIVGEINNIKFLTCCCLSKNLPRKYRLSAIIASDSSAGKSNLVNNLLMPFSGSVIDYTSFTNAFLTRQKTSFDGMILKLEQMEKTNENHQVTLSSLKFLLSEGVLKVGLVEQNGKGQHETRTLSVTGIPVFISTSTNFNIDPESLNRTFLMQVDESKEQTERIIDHTLRLYSSLERNETWKKDIEELEALFGMYEWIAGGVQDIVIPFGEKLKKIIPTEDLTIRRDLSKILNLTCVIAFIHFRNRKYIVDNEIKKQKNTENQPHWTVIAEPEDFIEALNIAGSTIRQTINKMNETGMSLYTSIKELLASKDPISGEDGKVSVKEISKSIRKSSNRTRELMKNLIEQGYLIGDYSEKEHKFSCTGKEFKDIKLDDLSFSLEEFESWKQKEILPNGQRLEIIEPSYDTTKPKNATL